MSGRMLAEMALKRRWAAEDLGDRLAQRRAELGLTQEAVAEAMQDVTLRAYQRWEAGEAVPQDRNIYKVAAVLEMDPGELIVELVPATDMAKPGQLERIERKLDQIITLLARRQTRVAAGKARAAKKARPPKRRRPASGP